MMDFKLNVLQTEEVPGTKRQPINFETYFDEMDLSEPEKEVRKRMAAEINLLLVYIFGLIVKMAESGYIDQGYVRSELKTGLTNIVNANDLASVKLGDDAMKYTENAIDTFTDDTLEKTYANLDDPWYLSDERATYIAANSTNSLRNLDDYIIAKKSGKKKKRWVTKMDLRVRKTHKITNGKLVDIDKPFVIGTSRLMFPCDTSLGASMSEIANCRCVCKYE